MGAGRYDDRFVRHEAGWRIADRRLSVIWTSGDESILDPRLPLGTALPNNSS